ncbi:hypothetical protein CR513_52613, partial [Mucuna pruriens]
MKKDCLNKKLGLSKLENFGCVYLGNDKSCASVRIREIKIQMYDGVVRTCEVRHILDLAFYKQMALTMKLMKVTLKASKGALTMMKVKKTIGNIYKLLENTTIGGVASVELDDDTTKL